MNKESKILITGGTGLAGMAITELLRSSGYVRLYTLGSHHCDLKDYKKTLEFFYHIKPEYVFHMAGFVRGIMGNMKNKATSFLDNVLINTHTIEACRKAGVKKIVAMGTVAAYPDPAPAYPITENMIWQGKPHGSEDSYGQAKRAMLAQLDAYQESYGMEYAFAVSTNLYGPHDNFDNVSGHVIPSLIRNFYEAKLQKTRVKVWGDGSSKRDFMHVTDMAKALVTVMEKGNGPINIGTGNSWEIKDVVSLLAAHTHMQGKVEWDTSKPNGQRFRECSMEKLFATGFRPLIPLEQGIIDTYEWYATHAAIARK